MAFDVGALVEQLAGKSLRDYQERSQAAVECLAGHAGLDPKVETGRFINVMERLRSGESKGPVTSEGLGGLQAAVIEQMPNVVELVMTYSGDGYRGFGYLTEGKPRSSLPQTLASQLENGLRSYLDHGGAMAEAGTLADVFALVFPDLSALSHHSPMAQAMLLGFVPRSSGLDLKVYFNTRILGGGSHRQRISSVLEYLGLEGLAHYDALYGGRKDLSFAGVGLDVDSGPARAKLYIRVERERLPAVLGELVETMGLSDPERAQQEAAQLLEAASGEASSDDVELAIGLSADGRKTLKLTTFFLGGSESGEPTRQVESYLESQGYSADVHREVVGVLSARVSKPGVKKQPIHAMGIEYPMGDSPKINVYVTPLL